jgi:hypothetical protein
MSAVRAMAISASMGTMCADIGKLRKHFGVDVTGAQYRER